jgi:hypothetical protein
VSIYRQLRSKAPALGLDPTRMVVSGSSAGAHPAREGGGAQRAQPLRGRNRSTPAARLPRGRGRAHRDRAEVYRPEPSVEAAWLAVTSDHGSDRPLYRLGEALFALDEKMSVYRWRHVTAVHRIIGTKRAPAARPAWAGSST